MIVVLSRFGSPRGRGDRIHARASGTCEGISGEQLAATLRGAYHGEPPLSRSLVPYLVDEIRRGSARGYRCPAAR